MKYSALLLIVTDTENCVALQVPEVSDQEVSQEEQLTWLAASCVLSANYFQINNEDEDEEGEDES